MQGRRFLARAASADSAILDKKALGSLKRVHNVPQRDGDGLKRKGRGGAGKSLAYESGSVRGDRFSVIINRTASTCTGNVLRMIMKKYVFDV